MLARKRNDAPDAGQRPGDALDRLVETERRLEDTLARADEEVLRILADAREADARADEALDGELRRAIAALDARYERELRAELVEVAARARVRAARWDRVGEARVRELARRILAGLAEDESAGPPA
jgi:hypothetical protein